MAIESLKKKMILALFIFNIAYWLYIDSKEKKRLPQKLQISQTGSACSDDAVRRRIVAVELVGEWTWFGGIV
jgi:hypothetical protein